MANELVVLVRLKAKPGMEEELRGSLIVDRARTEPGVEEIVVYEEVNDTAHLLLHEAFASEAEMNRYLALPYHREWEQTSKAFLDPPPAIAKLDDTQIEYLMFRRTTL